MPGEIASWRGFPGQSQLGLNGSLRTPPAKSGEADAFYKHVLRLLNRQTGPGYPALPSFARIQNPP